MYLRTLLVVGLIASLTGCARTTEAISFPWQLSCGDTPEGMVGIIHDQEQLLHIQIGNDLYRQAAFYFGICNRTATPIRMLNIQMLVDRTGHPATAADPIPFGSLTVFKHGGRLTLSSYALFGGSWICFVSDDMGDEIMPGDIRVFTVVAEGRDMDDEADIRLGTQDGAFAFDDGFMADSGPLDRSHIYHNVAIERHVSITH